jgi:hypothetical protein
MATHEEMVDAFGSALDGSDPDAFVGALAPGAIVWHNHDRKEVDARENMAGIGMLGQLVDGLTTESLLFAPIDGGFVLQYVTRGTVKSNGNAFEMHNCLIVTTTDDGLITRLDEYVDPTVGAQFA